MIQISFEINNWGYEPRFKIVITEFDISFPEDVKYDIYETWEYEGKRYCNLKPDSYPLYQDVDLKEKVIEYAEKDYFDNQREKARFCDEN